MVARAGLATMAVLCFILSTLYAWMQHDLFLTSLFAALSIMASSWFIVSWLFDEPKHGKERHADGSH